MDSRTDGRFFDFAQNDMLCNNHWRNLSVTPSFDCHPEEAVRPTRDSLAGGAPTRDAPTRTWESHGKVETMRNACEGGVDIPVCRRQCRRSPRANVISAYLALRTAEQTGDSSAALRMTCFAIAIVEMYPSFVSPYCHPEEDVRPARESSAGRLTKDLLRHRLIPSLLALNRRNRRHVCAHTVRPRWRVC